MKILIARGRLGRHKTHCNVIRALHIHTPDSILLLSKSAMRGKDGTIQFCCHLFCGLSGVCFGVHRYLGRGWQTANSLLANWQQVFWASVLTMDN